MLGLSLVERIVDWLGPAYEAGGYWLIAGAALLERSVFVGLIIPGDIILALGGVYSARGSLDVGWVIAIGSFFAICGESIGYWLGRKFGMRLIRHIPLVNRLEPRLQNAQHYFRDHGGWTVAIGRYATAAGAFVPFLAGVGKMPYRRFLLFDIPAIIVWATAITIFGYVSGRNIEFIDTVLSRFGYVVLALVIGFFATRFLLKRRRGRVSG